jgi:hypothetical protein
VAKPSGAHSVSSVDAKCYQHGGATITVTIKKKADGDPPLPPNIAVRLVEQAAWNTQAHSTFTATKTTDKHHQVKFRQLRPGRYYALAQHHGYGFVPTSMSSGPESPTTSLELVAFPNSNAIWGCDTNQSNLIVATAKHDPHPCKFVGRYISQDPTGDPPLTQGELPLYRNAGLDLVLVWERKNTQTDDQPTVAAQTQSGANDAKQALANMGAIFGAGAMHVVYFAADFTMTKKMRYGGAGALVRGYFEGVNQIFGGNTRVGAYGTYETIAMLFDATPKPLISWGWQMCFGSKGKALDKRVQLYQYDIMRDQTGWLPITNRTNIAGGLDMDVAVVPRFGQVRL